MYDLYDLDIVSSISSVIVCPQNLARAIHRNDIHFKDHGCTHDILLWVFPEMLQSFSAVSSLCDMKTNPADLYVTTYVPH